MVVQDTSQGLKVLEYPPACRGGVASTGVCLSGGIYSMYKSVDAKGAFYYGVMCIVSSHKLTSVWKQMKASMKRKGVLEV